LKKCEVCGSTKGKIYGKGGKHGKDLCVKHRHHMDRHGEIKSRTRYDQNKIVLYNDYAEIILYDWQQVENGRALIDLDNVDMAKKHKWSIDGRGYVTTSEYPYTLHRFVMGDPNGLEVDHIFHNLLDNRKEKLRVATRSQNNMNHGLSSHNTSGHKGVSYAKNVKAWEVYIHQYGKKISFGHYKDINDAIAKRSEAEKIYFGDYADKRG
jgi:hypothetical protein